MFPRFQRCRGLRIPLWGNRQVEVWWCPAGEQIGMHHHERCHSRVMFLGGKMNWASGRRVVQFRGRHLFRSLVARAGESHGAVVTGRFGLFMNIQHWTHNRTSAAHDFIAH